MVGKKYYQRYTEAHPASALANQYGKKSVKDTQIDKIIKNIEQRRQVRKYK